MRGRSRGGHLARIWLRTWWGAALWTSHGRHVWNQTPRNEIWDHELSRKLFTEMINEVRSRVFSHKLTHNQASFWNHWSRPLLVVGRDAHLFVRWSFKVHETFLELLSDHRSQINLKICYLHSFLRWNLNCSCVSSTAIEGENTVFTNQSWISMLLEINPKTTIELVFTTGDDQNKLWSAFCFRDLSKLADLQQWRLSLGSFWFHIWMN